MKYVQKLKEKKMVLMNERGLSKEKFTEKNQVTILALTILDMKYSFNGINSRMETKGKEVSEVERRSIEVRNYPILRIERKRMGKIRTGSQ